jgi:RimJ/RimL family protein N-acetyltransferase
MIIREAQLTDAKQIAEIHVRSWQTAYAGLIPASQLERLSIKEREFVWKKRLMDSNRALTLVFVEQMTVAGWATVGPARDDDCHPSLVSELYGIYFSPGYWGRGCGTQLYQAIEKRLTAATKEVVVWVLKGNARGRRFYEANGFLLEPDRGKEEKFGTVRLSEVRYRKEVVREGKRNLS